MSARRRRWTDVPRIEKGGEIGAAASSRESSLESVPATSVTPEPTTTRTAIRPTDQPKPRAVSVGGAQLELADAADRYASWPAPTVLIVDGPYGVGGYPGDPPTPRGLSEWYEPHIEEWATRAKPSATLWFWNTEVGWANVHPVLERHDWEYRSLHVWNKGIGHIAGNVNGNSIRRFPVVTEVCAQYVRVVRLETESGERLPLKEWLRAEWQRSGLPLSKTNEACGVKNAATRKYFTQCHLWYFPPPEMMERLAAYAIQHGRETKRPYFSIDGKTPLSADQWEPMRAKWNHSHGITNVWDEPAVRGDERLKLGLKSLHSNQKPLKLMERIIAATSDPGDVVWDPFGGLCSGAIASLNLHRECYAAELNPVFFELASERLRSHGQDLDSRLFQAS